MKLWCATTNPDKMREFRLSGADVGPLPGLRDIPPSLEDGATFDENAIQKAIYYSRFAAGPLFADDSGLVVDALNGSPGVLSARFAGKHATPERNNAQLLERLKGIDNRRARFVAVIALAKNGKLIRTFRGEIAGEILRAARGDGGFGYDPLFFYPPLGRSLAELSDEEKFEISHRGQALRTMIESFGPAERAEVSLSKTRSRS